jgi:hypothetical protein
MNRRHRIAAAAGLLLLAAAVFSGIALANHGGLHGLFNARGTIDSFEIRDRDAKLKITAREPIDVAIVGAQLDPGAQTGWHTHPTDSIVSVQPGGPTLKMVTNRHGTCVEETFGPGRAFVHPAGPHNFVNTNAAQPLSFGVVYLVPVGATLLTPVPTPDGCR